VAMDLLAKLSRNSRKRWPSDAVAETASRPGLLPIVS
jgi:coenzyme F420 hydrogenase subunit beta